MTGSAQTAWTPLEMDALQETINIGVGRAVAVLNEMTGSEILITAPELTVADLRTLCAALNSEVAGDAVSIRQGFEGKINGAATLVFTEPSSRTLVEMLLGGLPNVDINPELEAEALAELGNIVINCCVGQLAEQLTGELAVHLPIVCKGDASRTLREGAGGDAWDAFLVRVSLTSNPAGIGGLIVFTLQSGHLWILRGLINDFVGAQLSA